MGKPVVHFQIDARTPKQLHKFYAQLFDWKIDAQNPMGYGFVDTRSKQGIGGGIGEAGRKRGLTVFVEVKDLEGTLAKAVQLGGKVLQKPTEIPGYVTLAFFADPEGNRIGLMSEGA